MARIVDANPQLLDAFSIDDVARPGGRAAEDVEARAKIADAPRRERADADEG
jgi:hypothetical protein